MASTLDQQLNIYLQDLHAIELQALEQVKRAPKVAGDPEIAAAFTDHLRETERHRTYVEDRLTARDWAPVPQKDLTARVSGVGMALFARFQPDTPGKLVAHAYSYERMELAAYELLGGLAQRAGDEDTVLTARMIAAEERAMAERLASLFDRAVAASLRGEDAGKQLTKYLGDAHAIEKQAAKLLEKAPEMAGAEELADVFAEHLEQTKRHGELVAARLEARGAGPSALKDTALRLGALNIGMFLKAQPDVPAKLAAFAYAFEHLEIASYEMLRRVALQAEDSDTAAVAGEILVQEQAAAGLLHDLLGTALDAAVEEAVTEA